MAAHFAPTRGNLSGGVRSKLARHVLYVRRDTAFSSTSVSWKAIVALMSRAMTFLSSE